MAKYLIIDKWHVGMIHVDDPERIIITAAKIVRVVIREKKYNVNSYPTNEDILDQNGEDKTALLKKINCNRFHA